MRKIFFLTTVSIALLLIGGCAENISPNTYTTSEVNQASRAVPGVIVSMRAIKIDNNSGAGGIIGVAGGAVAGSTIGSGATANILGGIGGAVAGGLLGNAIDKGIHQAKGYEYVVKLKDKSKSMVTIVQVDVLDLSVGQKVLVMYGNKTRLVPDRTISK